MTICYKCHDTVIVFICCCSGYMCGCMGMPVAAKGCDCGKGIDSSKLDETEKLLLENVEWLGASLNVD